MRRLSACLAVATALATPAFAALQPGDTAPDFTARAYLAGKSFTFKLTDALRNRPVVLYFFPAAHTDGCNLEAHLFSEAADQFKAQKVTLIGVTAGRTEQLAEFSKETEHCAGRFPVAADPGAVIATAYGSSHEIEATYVATMNLPKVLSGRISYVLAPDRKVLLTYRDKDPNDHVNQTLAAVRAYRAAK